MPRPNRKDRYKQSEQKGRLAEITILVSIWHRVFGQLPDAIGQNLARLI